MKNHHRNASKLALRKETLRTLDHLALADVVGGAPVLTFFTLRSCVDACPTIRICNTTPAP